MTQWRDRAARFGWPTIAFHWLAVVLVAAMYVTVEWREFVPKPDPLRDQLIALHKSLGVIILALVAVRLVLRRRDNRPPIVPAMPAWQDWASRLVHYALYAMLLVLPITGYLMSNAGDRPVAVFGLVLPTLIAPNKELASTLKDIHEIVANIGYGLIAAHAVAALWHHFVQRDNTLRRMLPGGAAGA